MMGPIGMPELVIIAVILASVLVVMWPAARICKRIGSRCGSLRDWFVALSPWPQTEASDRVG